jgi:hypothetical protein
MTPGVSILSHQEEIGSPGGNQQLVFEHQPIDLSTVSWPLVLELRYDDSTELVTTAYSLDGGASFSTPFTALPLESADGTAAVSIAATAHEGDCPAGIAIGKAGLAGLGEPGKGRITMRAQVGGSRRGSEPMRIVVTDQGAGGAALLDVTLPDNLAATPRCDPADGWSTRAGFRSRYSNGSDALPPDCVPGSAQGLESVDFRWTGTNHVKLKVKRATLPAVVGPIRLEIYPNGGPVNECDGFVGEADCITSPRRAKCSVAD